MFTIFVLVQRKRSDGDVKHHKHTSKSQINHPALIYILQSDRIPTVSLDMASVNLSSWCSYAISLISSAMHMSTSRTHIPLVFSCSHQKYEPASGKSSFQELDVPVDIHSSILPVPSLGTPPSKQKLAFQSNICKHVESYTRKGVTFFTVQLFSTSRTFKHSPDSCMAVLFRNYAPFNTFNSRSTI